MSTFDTKDTSAEKNYNNLAAWGTRNKHTEEHWPEYKNYLGLVSRRKYRVDTTIAPEERLTMHLEVHVQDAQERSNITCTS